VIKIAKVLTMLEYVLFHEKPFNMFVEYLKSRGIAPQTTRNGEIFEISFPDNITDELSEEVEEKYDQFMSMNQEMFYAENADDEENYRMASIMITLTNGDLTSADIRPELMAKIIDSVGEIELNELVTAVVKAVENPDGRTFCERFREKKQNKTSAGNGEG
jgi:signal transduction histidine kinase